MIPEVRTQVNNVKRAILFFLHYLANLIAIKKQWIYQIVLAGVDHMATIKLIDVHSDLKLVMI